MIFLVWKLCLGEIPDFALQNGDQTGRSTSCRCPGNLCKYLACTSRSEHTSESTALIQNGHSPKCHSDKLCHSLSVMFGLAEFLNSKCSQTSAEKSGSYSSHESVDGICHCLSFNYIIPIHRWRAEYYIVPST